MISNDKKIKIAFVSGGADSEYNNVFANYLSEECRKCGFHVIWYQSIAMGNYQGTPHEVGEMNIYNLINYDAIDALVMLTVSLKSEQTKKDIISRCAKNIVPLISVDEEVEGAYSIISDYNDSLAEIIDHVIEKHGAKTLNFIGGEKGNAVSDAREEIYRKVLGEHNIPVEEKRIGYAWFWHETAGQLFEQWHNEGIAPDAVICANDSMAIGVCNKAVKLGYKVPEDVIVTGVDGVTEARSYYPSITSIKINIPKVSKRITEIISGILDGSIKPVGYEKLKAARLYSQSCGCEPMDGAGSDNLVKHELYEAANKFKGLTKTIINTADEVVIDEDFRVTLDRLKVFLEQIWTKASWICICDDFVSDIGGTEDIHPSRSNYRKAGYSENIKYCVQYLDKTKEITRLPEFKTTELLPDLDEIFDHINNITVQPLHFQDRCIGYLAVEYDYCLGNFSMLNTFDCGIISLVLENARVQSELCSFANMLEEMYIRDPMTKLLNRRGFYKAAPKIYNKCLNEELEFMIVSVDMDNLKTINDTYGHAEGDNAIIKIAEALNSVSQGGFITARFGGDEYVAAGICLSDGYGKAYVRGITEYLDDYNKTSGKPYTLGASCGVYKAVPGRDVTLDEFISEADKIMYSVKKRRKRNRPELSRRR